MADTGTHSHPQHEDEEHVPKQQPTATESQETQQSPAQQPPYSESTETLDLPNPLQSSLHDPEVQISQQSDKEEDTPLISDQQLQQTDDHQSGTTHTTLPEPIILPDDTQNPPPPPAPPLSSPMNPQRRFNKRKKAGGRKNFKRKRPLKRVQSLTDNLNPIPFVPAKSLDFDKHQEVLKRLGLLDFSKIEFDRSIKNDLIAQLIVNYDSKKRYSYVNEKRVMVNRADLARALSLPPAKQDKGSTAIDEVDLDSEVFSDEAIEFIEDFVLNYMLLHDKSWVMPTEITNWIRCIKDGHPEKMDSASLIWYMVEKELTQGTKLSDCYYASHLQHLIKSQHVFLFSEDDDEGDEDDGEDIVKPDEDKEEKQEKPEIEESQEKEEKEEKDANLSVVQQNDIGLGLAPDVEEIVHEVKNDDDVMVDAEECNNMEEQGNWSNVLGDEPLLQRCQSSDLNNYEKTKVEEVEDEQFEQVEDEQIEHVQDEQIEHVQDEQIEHVEDEDEEQEEEEEEEGERADEGFEIGPNDDSMDRDGLTDNFLGVGAHNIPFNSHGISSMDLFGSRDNSFMSHGGPSFFNNGGKRVMEPEEDMHDLDVNNKRLKTNEIWDEKRNDFGVCMEQMQQWMEKAKMIYVSKEQSYENLQYNQQIAMNQLQERQNYMQMLMKSKDEELEKKNSEIFRLERELYLMTDLLSGYRKALNDTQFKFSEYRKRFVLQEEPLYKDAGPGGLVLSTRELEKIRLKEEEDMREFLMLANNFEKDCVCQLKMHEDKVLSMVDKLVSIENEVKRLKEIATQCKENQKLLDKNEKSVEFEENQKFSDENEKSVEFEENQKLLDKNEKSVEFEENQKFSDENEKSVEFEENQKFSDENEKSVEFEENQKLLDENEKSVEFEENQKSIDEQDVILDQKRNQNSQDEIMVNDASVETVPPDADESEEKGGGEDQIGEE